MKVRFAAELWEHEGDAPWVFVTLPSGIADDVEARAPQGPGFGSVKVEVTVGTTCWRTSLFPDKASESYVLPVKRQVRNREGLSIGDTIRVVLDLIDD